MNEFLRKLVGRRLRVTTFNTYGCILKNRVCQVQEIERMQPYDVCSIKVSFEGEKPDDKVKYLYLYNPAAAKLVEGEEVYESTFGVVRPL